MCCRFSLLPLTFDFEFADYRIHFARYSSVRIFGLDIFLFGEATFPSLTGFWPPAQSTVGHLPAARYQTLNLRHVLECLLCSNIPRLNKPPQIGNTDSELIIQWIRHLVLLPWNIYNCWRPRLDCLHIIFVFATFDIRLSWAHYSKKMPRRVRLNRVDKTKICMYFQGPYSLSWITSWVLRHVAGDASLLNPPPQTGNTDPEILIQGIVTALYLSLLTWIGFTREADEENANWLLQTHHVVSLHGGRALCPSADYQCFNGAQWPACCHCWVCGDYYLHL